MRRCSDILVHDFFPQSREFDFIRRSFFETTPSSDLVTCLDQHASRLLGKPGLMEEFGGPQEVAAGVDQFVVGEANRALTKHPCQLVFKPLRAAFPMGHYGQEGACLIDSCHKKFLLIFGCQFIETG